MSNQPKPTTGGSDEAHRLFEQLDQVKGFRAIDSKCLRTQEEEIRRLREQLATAQGAQHHMEACRALLNVPNDDVLYGAIEELQQQLAAERGRKQ